jgi:hypothetical protein
MRLDELDDGTQVQYLMQLGRDELTTATHGAAT